MHRVRRQEGVALLITILVIALMTIIVVEFTHTTQIETHLTRHALSSMQAAYLARAGVALAEVTMKVDAEIKAKSQPKISHDTLTDLWARPFPPQAVGENVGAAGFAILDESARFNVNALALKGAPGDVALESRKTIFQSILAAVGLEPNLIFPLLDWLDAGEDVSGQSGAEAEYYLGLAPPYRPRDGRLLTLDELGLVKGFERLTREQWRALRSVLSVNPDETLRINVNTAPEPLLLAILSAVDAPGVAKTILESRELRPLDDPALKELLDSTQIPRPIRSVFATSSTNFTIHGVGVAADVTRGLAVTERRTGGKLERLEWRDEVARTFTLTSQGASDGIGPPPP